MMSGAILAYKPGIAPSPWGLVNFLSAFITLLLYKYYITIIKSTLAPRGELCKNKYLSQLVEIVCRGHQIQFLGIHTYRQTCYISPTWVGNKIVEHSDVVGASLQWVGQIQLQDDTRII